MTNPTPAKRKIHALGPGTLTIGETGARLDMSCQLTELTIGAEGNSEDSEFVLCGDEVAGARTYAWTMAGSIFQDIEIDGVVDFTWKNAGAEVPFSFAPDLSSGSTVVGTVRIDPVTLGGTVKQKNKSDIEWSIIGNPVFTPSGAGGTQGTTPGDGS